MVNKLLNMLGLITKKQAEEMANLKALQAVKDAKESYPTSEILDFVRRSRKYGFKTIYALSDNNQVENAIKLAESYATKNCGVDSNMFVKAYMPNIKAYKDAGLLN